MTFPKFKLSKDWRIKLKYWSFRFQILIGGLAGIYLLLPEDKQADILTSVFSLIGFVEIRPAFFTFLSAVITMGFQLYRQDSVAKAEEKARLKEQARLEVEQEEKELAEAEAKLKDAEKAQTVFEQDPK